MNLIHNKTFFTSDLHFYHKNILQYSNRPFANVEEMNESIISRWNQTVPPDGITFSLGDFSFCKIQKTINILNRLNGKIVLIDGNHDKEIIKNRELILETGKVDILAPYKEININGQFICLFHYGCRVWNKSHRGSWLLYGHSHDSLPPLGKSVDVGVDSTAILGYAPYRPFTFEEIKQFMDNREIYSPDHHREE